MVGLISFVVPTHNRKQDLIETLERIQQQQYDEVEAVVVSDSDDGTRELFADGARFDRDWIRFTHVDERIGIARALNEAVERADGDVIVTLDDDSRFVDDGALGRVVETFEADPELGLLGFRVVNGQSGEEEFPGRKTNEPGLTGKVPFVGPIVDLPTGPDVDGPIKTTYFPGCGYAVRAEVYEEIGRHPPTFFYGAYEDDLAFRVMDTSYSLQYHPDITVEHMRSPDGAIPSDERFSMNYTNKIAIAVRHLPWRYVLLTAILWGGSTLYRTGLTTTLAALRRVAERRERFLSERDVLDPETIQYVEANGGRFY